MPLFEIMTPRTGGDLAQTTVLADRFSWSAALVPPVWALSHGLWLESFGWIVLTVLIVVAGLFLGGAAAFWLYVLFAAWIGFAASDIRMAALKRRGNMAAGTRIAEDEYLAERDWLEEKFG